MFNKISSNINLLFTHKFTFIAYLCTPMKKLFVIVLVVLCAIVEVMLCCHESTLMRPFDNECTTHVVCAIDAPPTDCVVSLTEIPNVPGIKVNNAFGGTTLSVKFIWCLSAHNTTITEYVKVRSIMGKLCLSSNAFNKQIDYNIYRLLRLLI